MSDQRLQKILRQGLAWRGWESQQRPGSYLDTGYETLNARLHEQGWPQGGLIEVFSSTQHHAEWMLYFPALRTLCERHPNGHIVLLNPPFVPCAEAWAQQNLPLDQFLLVEATKPRDILMSFRELAKAKGCIALLLWQPHLNYAELRQCQLALQHQQGLYVMFNHDIKLKQASPSILKLKVSPQPHNLKVQILKQRGALHNPQNAQAVNIATNWAALAPTFTPLHFSEYDHSGTVVKHSL